MFWFATKLRKSMEIGNGIDRRKPLNAHVNLHRLMFYISHTLGEIYTARKSFTSLVGTVGQLSLSTMNVFTTFVKQKGEKWYGKISKWRFFYPLFLLQIWRCVYPCTSPSWKPDYLIVSFCVFANCNQGRLRLSLSHQGRWAHLPVLCLTSAEPTHSGSSNVTHLGPRWVIRK